MSFTNASAEVIDDLKVMLNIAELLKTLLDDNRLESVIKGFYKLNDSESAQYMEARGTISQYQALAKENEKRRIALDEFHKSLIEDQRLMQERIQKTNAEFAEREAAIEAERLKNEEISKNLDVREKQIEKQNDEVNRKINDLAFSNQENELTKANLRKEEADLEARKKQVDEYEASLKSKASQLQKLTEAI